MEYVCTGATLKCTMGTATSTLKATPKNVTLVGKDQANIADYVSMTNVPGFGKCRSLAYPPTASATAANHGRLTPMPCVPGTCPKWQAVDKDSLVCGEPALLKSATLKCMYGGTISIINPGQNKEIKDNVDVGVLTGAAAPIEMEELKDNEMESSGLNPDSVLDGIQLTLDAAGLVPIVGAAPDLLNAAISAARGNYVEAGMSLFAAVPGIGDAAGAAKIAYKGAKIAGKATKTNKVTKTISSAKSINELETVSEAVRKGPNKELLEARAKMAGIDPKDIKTDSYFDEAPTDKSPKFLELTGQQRKNSIDNKNLENINDLNNPFNDLTKNDQFEYNKVDTWKEVENAHKETSWNYYTVKQIDKKSPTPKQELSKETSKVNKENAQHSIQNNDTSSYNVGKSASERYESSQRKNTDH